ncbi:putative disease resistance protein RGA3 [Papaver somniferum]|uniref:putative disease resistance protein RGA3 n=1 Tax=Papaver somniferum TaxID=3469 RepID=UPI000E6F587F|nr:putative disease resistance protein RGA3 [Papaver somniferum]
MERLLVSGANELVRNLGSVVGQQIGIAWGVKDELEILKRALETIAAVTTDAEKQQGESDLSLGLCVDDFNIKNILVKIIESVTSKKCDISNDVVLFSKVREGLSNKRYLLVLDDLWSEDAEDWDKLKGLLNVGDHGSKVLITTRSNVVASIIRDITPPYILKELTDYVCWSIIKNKAFSPGGALEGPNMTCIGEKIAKRCGGLPLASCYCSG